MIVEVKIEPTEYESTAIEWARMYANDVATIEKIAAKSSPFLYCIMDIYKSFLDNCKMTMIENLPDEEKRILFDKSREVFPANTTPTRRKQYCIFIYLMSFVFDKYFVV